MAPSVLPLVAALFRQSSANWHEDTCEMSLLQMPVKEVSMQADAGDSDAKGAADSACACPGYYMDECNAHAEQGCTWTDAGESNAAWCQCDEEAWNAWRERRLAGPQAPDAIQYLVVAGGGGGGSGGGGAGGVKQGTVAAPQESITIEVGAGGSHGMGGSRVIEDYQGGTIVFGSAGGNSALNTPEPVIAHGGGSGGQGGLGTGPGEEGGSGGGGSADGGSLARTSGMSGEGHGGGRSDRGGGFGGAGGGGGAGGPGQDASRTYHGGSGGIGVTSDVGCVAGQWYGGGGGGGVNAADQNNGDGNRGGTGGQGGGGDGSSFGVFRSDQGLGFTGTDGTPNTGGGGGGTDLECQVAGNGGSGIVRVKYPGAQFYAGGEVESCDGFTVHTFATPGIHHLQALH